MEPFYPSDFRHKSEVSFPLKEPPYSSLPFSPCVTRSLVAFKAPQWPLAGDGGPWGPNLGSKSLGLNIP